MKQIKLFIGYKPEDVTADANAWLAEQNKEAAQATPKKGKKKDAEAKPDAETDAEAEAPVFEHEAPQVAVVNSQFIIAITYTA